MLFPVLAAVVATLGVGGAYYASGVRRAVFRVRRSQREAAQQIRKTEQILASRERALKETARHYRDADARRRLEEVSLDVLREQTEGRVKIAPLEQAGYATVADLVGKSRRELRAVRGIGPHSARAVEHAVREYLRTARTIAPPLPAPELEEPRAVDLARDCLVFLEAWREVGDAPARMREALDALDVRSRLEEASFLRWLGGCLQRGLNRERAARLAALADEVHALHASPPFVDAAGARRRLRDTAVPADDVRALFRRHYAESCALLERIFEELDLEVRPARARRPVVAAAPAEAEIARRVERFPLDTRGLRLILRRYQVFGAKYLLALERTVLGDEMGLGKTIQALAAQLHLANRREYCCSLVVAPASILANWLHEIALRTPLRGHLLHGDDLDASLAAWVAQGGVAVTSYTTLRRNVTDFVHRGPPEIALLVADEAHYVKNPTAQRTRALIRLSDRADKVCFMSGTPLENHPEEFVHLLGSLAPARARDLDAFLKRPGSVLGGPRRFHAELADVYLRRNQEDVLRELPERIDKEEWVDLGPAELAAYAERVAAGDFMGMRRAVTVGHDAERSAKLERLADLLDEYRESGVKVLLFSYFLDVLEAVQRHFEAQGRITGAVPPAQRFRIAQGFQEAEGHQLLIAQVDAGGIGLNLHAAGAVVIMEPQLKPTTEAQAIARAHRMGQTRRVVVHRLLARDSVDARLLEMLAQKRDLFERFARESLIKEASEEATAAAPARVIIEAERERLGESRPGAGLGCEP
ncbi:MAG: DEAD/DEAH box helicase [Planctomycetota bacterium]|jgi:superfamily II DNA or RNA helicase